MLLARLGWRSGCLELPTNLRRCPRLGFAHGLRRWASAIVARPIARRLSFTQAIIGAVWVDALLFPLILVVPNVFLIEAVNAVIFAMNPVYNVVQFSYRLALIPDRLQGRVNSAFRLIAWGSQPLGAALAGALLQWIGVEYAVGVFAAVLVMLGLVAATNYQIRHARPISQVQAEG